MKKADRAKVHLKTLATEIQRLVKPDVHGIRVAERNPKTGKYALRVFTRREPVPPLRWSILIGEFAYNLRSALDHIACQLALGNNWPAAAIPTLLEKTSFPIYLYSANRLSKPADKRWSTNKRPMAYMTPYQRALLERFQPYHRRNMKDDAPIWATAPTGRLHPLWLLHELNNADKHRLLQVTAAVASGLSLIVRSAPSTFRVKSINTRLGAKLINGAYVGAIDIDGDWEGVDMNFSVTQRVVFWDGCDAVKGLPVLRTLEAMFHTVAYEILVPLAKEFPPLDPPYGPPE
jgi:hypothetical protein